MDEKMLAMFKEKEQQNRFTAYNHIEMVMIEQDHAIFRLNICPESKNSFGMVHGGAIYAMADNATGFAAHTDGRNYVTQTSGGRDPGGRKSASPGPLHLSGSSGHSGRGRNAAGHRRIHILLRGHEDDGAAGQKQPVNAAGEGQPPLSCFFQCGIRRVLRLPPCPVFTFKTRQRMQKRAIPACCFPHFL